MKLSRQQIHTFRKTIIDYYKNSGRTKLPWREKITPYKIWISEIMLQQTQVDRVIPFFNNWMKRFPTVQKLANASQIELLQQWKGLGYNSRALRIKKCAQEIIEKYHGIFPNKSIELQKLPGIGPYTAGAICAFAYNQPVVIIETNIRRVFIHHFFQDHENISDDQILALVQKTLPEKDIRQWYWALMDYGAFLGRTLNIHGKKYNPNVQSKHYNKQSKFIGSDRQIRGKILEVLLQERNNTITIIKLKNKIAKLTVDDQRIQKILDQLQAENFVTIQKKNIQLKK